MLHVKVLLIWARSKRRLVGDMFTEKLQLNLTSCPARSSNDVGQTKGSRIGCRLHQLNQLDSLCLSATTVASRHRRRRCRVEPSNCAPMRRFPSASGRPPNSTRIAQAHRSVRELRAAAMRKCLLAEVVLLATSQLMRCFADLSGKHL